MTNLFRTEKERHASLSPIERDSILKINPDYADIRAAVYFDNYDLPCPIKVEVMKKSGNDETIVLRKNRHGDIQNEVRMFRALKEFGLPVPEILSEPFENEQKEYVAIYSLLPGENLQKLAMRGDEHLEEAKNLLIEAVLKLKNVTSLIKRHEVSEIIPELPLNTELETLNTGDNIWLKDDQYLLALKKVEAQIQTIHTPLILSNGDYQPGNFLAQNGKLTGFLDFESATFQDPLMGFVKYPIYDMIPLARTDLVDTFLIQSGFSKKDFNVRLVLGCLKPYKEKFLY